MKKDVIVASESDVIVYLDGVNPKTQPATVRENGNYSNITLEQAFFFNGIISTNLRQYVSLNLIS